MTVAEPDLSAVWAELDLPRSFPEEVEAEARAAVDAHADGRRDATDIPFVTVDPPGSMDLDQALAVEAHRRRLAGPLRHRRRRRAGRARRGRRP